MSALRAHTHARKETFESLLMRASHVLRLIWWTTTMLREGRVDGDSYHLQVASSSISCILVP